MVQADAHGIEHGGAAASLGHPPSPLLERPRRRGPAVARPMRGGGSARLREREGVWRQGDRVGDLGFSIYMWHSYVGFVGLMGRGNELEAVMSR